MSVIKAGFVSSAPNWQWIRQFPAGVPRWGDVEFSLSGDMSDCDVVFVYDAIPRELSGHLAANRSMFLASEPASVKSYQPRFLQQFDCVLTTDPNTTHAHVLMTQPALPWLIGAYDAAGQPLDKAMTARDFEDYAPIKDKSISVITSSKTMTAGHRARLEFVTRLKDYFGDEIDLFGRGIRNFGDKTDTISRYRYHIAIENSQFSHYWTEKLSDPILALTHPIYFGCPNIRDYFDDRMVSTIDISDSDGAIRIIKKILDSDRAENTRAHMIEARRRVLNEYNLFSILAELATAITQKEPTGSRQSAFLQSERSFVGFKGRFVRPITHAIRRVLNK
ncbi:glycosyltransferase family 10 domain-containing protein [Oryzibacter oryziterrae]|uniref:glycosyltransferase family 10 domain-containing protein n=1 Tax=Oryzibacter oryziterrae TaxID=2766474 RepID=UPI001F027D29|nr:glycosyltransferase family 10 [Oryzibacter oryziterrae]